MHVIIRVLTVLTVGLLLLVGSGCAAIGTGPQPATAASPTASNPTSPHPSPTLATTTSPPTAADGTDLTACADGVCEVRVDGPAKIPVPQRGGLREVRVERGSSGPQLVILGPSGFRAVVGGSGTTSLREGAVLSMEAIDGESVILTVSVP